MRPRLSLTGQLLALQLVIISVVLVGVAAVTVAQSTARFRDTETRRARAVAEPVAGNATVRSTLEGAGSLTLLRSIAESARSVSDSSYVVVTDANLEVLASPDPAQLGRRYDLGASDVLDRRAWVGTVREGDRLTVTAHVPVLSEAEGNVGRLLGVVAVGREHPSLMDVLRLAAPNLLTYLGLSSLLGVAGSLLIARRVKRQTFGLDPVEIAGLVEHRGAMLYGIKEGVLGLDLNGRVTLVNDEATHLLRLPADAVGRLVSELPLDERLREALTARSGVPDQVVPAEGRVLILNSLPITSRGVRIGSVTTLRDRTELLTLQRELDVTRHATDTLRAQAHEFSNRLHTISGLIELGEYGEVVQYVHRLHADVARMTDDVTSRVEDPAVAALLIAKGNQADERGVHFVVSPATRLPRLEDHLSTDVATVVGKPRRQRLRRRRPRLGRAAGRRGGRGGRRAGAGHRAGQRARRGTGPSRGSVPAWLLHQGFWRRTRHRAGAREARVPAARR